MKQQEEQENGTLYTAYTRTLAALCITLDAQATGLDVQGMTTDEARAICKGFTRAELERMARVLSMILCKDLTYKS